MLEEEEDEEEEEGEGEPGINVSDFPGVSGAVSFLRRFFPFSSSQDLDC